jgi:hypothetical protein
MSKLIERLDELNKSPTACVYEKFTTELAEAYPKLRDVVLAAEAWAWINEPITMQEQELQDVLMALEEVCI